MNKLYLIGLCGLTARDARLIEIVIARAPNPKYQLRVGDASSIGRCDLVIVDTQAPLVGESLAKARSLNPQLVVVEITDQASVAEQAYRVQRSSLLLMILRTIERAIEERLLHRTAAPTGAGLASKPGTDGRPAEAIEGDTGSSPMAASLQPLSALVVDDSLAVRTQLEAVLARVGIKAVLAEHADAALAKVGQQSFDLIFLDVVMPGIDGYELCRRIKHNPYARKIPVLMLTSRSSPFDRARGALAGCDAYLVKPITSATFFAAVDKILTKQHHGSRDSLFARGYRTAAV